MILKILILWKFRLETLQKIVKFQSPQSVETIQIVYCAWKFISDFCQFGWTQLAAGLVMARRLTSLSSCIGGTLASKDIWPGHRNQFVAVQHQYSNLRWHRKSSIIWWHLGDNVGGRDMTHSCGLETIRNQTKRRSTSTTIHAGHCTSQPTKPKEKTNMNDCCVAMTKINLNKWNYSIESAETHIYCSLILEHVLHCRFVGILEYLYAKDTSSLIKRSIPAS